MDDFNSFARTATDKELRSFLEDCGWPEEVILDYLERRNPVKIAPRKLVKRDTA